MAESGTLRRRRGPGMAGPMGGAGVGALEQRVKNGKAGQRACSKFNVRLETIFLMAFKTKTMVCESRD